jgi:hypothetical protein
MLVIDDWLYDRLEERRSNLASSDDPHDFAMLAGVLRAEAIAYGFPVEALEDACDADIPTFLMMNLQPCVAAVNSALKNSATSVAT